MAFKLSDHYPPELLILLQSEDTRDMARTIIAATLGVDIPPEVSSTVEALDRYFAVKSNLPATLRNLQDPTAYVEGLEWVGIGVPGYATLTDEPVMPEVDVLPLYTRTLAEVLYNPASNCIEVEASANIHYDGEELHTYTAAGAVYVDIPLSDFGLENAADIAQLSDEEFEELNDAIYRRLDASAPDYIYEHYGSFSVLDSRCLEYLDVHPDDVDIDSVSYKPSDIQYGLDCLRARAAMGLIE